MNVQRFNDGRITLIHGDCLEVMPRMKAGLVDMVFADLPYGTTDNTWDNIIDPIKLWQQLNRIGKDRTAQVFTATQPFTTLLIQTNLANYRHIWVWNKKLTGSFGTAKTRPLPITEDVIVFGQASVNYYPIMRKGVMRKKGGTYKKALSDTAQMTRTARYNDDYYPTNIIEIGNTDRRNSYHSAQKPVELVEYLIKTYTNENDLVFDPTMGSGTSAVACINTNRRFIGVELEAEHFGTALRRVTGDLA